MSISPIDRPTSIAPTHLTQPLVRNLAKFATGPSAAQVRNTASQAWSYASRVSAGAYRTAEQMISALSNHRVVARDILTSSTAGVSTLMLMGADGDGMNTATKWIAGSLLFATAAGIGIWKYRNHEKENSALPERKFIHVTPPTIPAKSAPQLKNTDAIDFSKYPTKEDEPLYILFVEDDQDLLEGYQDFFAASDFSNMPIRFAGNYASLITILKHHGRPGIIVTDGDLDDRFGKKSNGYALFHKGFFDFGIPLIIQTGNGVAQMQMKYADYRKAQELGLLHITKGSGALEKIEAALKKFVNQISENQNKEAI